MNTSSVVFAQRENEAFDIGPLSWVIDDIKLTLKKSAAALDDALLQDASVRETSLRHAKSHLHQAHGAIQMVDVEGITLITETVEDLIDLIISGVIALTADVTKCVADAYRALTRYLEELIAGATHQPVRLFPYYRALLEAKGASRIHPADLFFPNLAVRPQFSAMPSEETTSGTYAPYRLKYERELLPFLRANSDGGEIEHARRMLVIISEIENRQAQAQTRAFWWVMHAFAEGVAEGQIATELYVKQLFARINLQIRRLCMGEQSLSERLLRDALFFIAAIQTPSALGQSVQQAYQLAGRVPENYSDARYNEVDANLLASAKEHLSQAKVHWSRLVSGEGGNVDSLEHDLFVLNEIVGKLPSAGLHAVTKALRRITKIEGESRPNETLGMEVASSLLFVEDAVQHIAYLPLGFEEKANALARRLKQVAEGQSPTEDLVWLDDISRKAQQKQTMTAVVGEMLSSLRQVEKILDEFFRESSDFEPLGQVDALLNQVQGALSILEQPEAVSALAHTRTVLANFLTDTVEESGKQLAFNNIAQNIGAVGFFIESMLHDAATKSTKYSFDEEQGVFKVNLAEKKKIDAGSDSGDAYVVEVDTHSFADLTSHGERASGAADALISNEELPRQAGKHGIDALKSYPSSSGGVQNTIFADAAHIAHATGPFAATLQKQDLQSCSLSRGSEQDESGSEEVDAELLEIFLIEAVEVLGTIRAGLPVLAQEPENLEVLTTLRRGFHTLKGSSRMVGLTAFGEAAWSMEQLLNLLLADEKPCDAPILSHLSEAEKFLTAWVDDLTANGSSQKLPDVLVAATTAIAHGTPSTFTFNEGASANRAAIFDSQTPEDKASVPEKSEPALADVTSILDQLDSESNDPLAAAQFEFESADSENKDEAGRVQIASDEVDAAADVAMQHLASVADEEISIDELASLGAQENESFPAVASVASDNSEAAVKQLGEQTISLPLFNIFLAESDELVSQLEKSLAQWKNASPALLDVLAVHAAHSLAGSSATVGIAPLRDLARVLERVLNFAFKHRRSLMQADIATLERTIVRLRAMLHVVNAGDLPTPAVAEIDELSAMLRSLNGQEQVATIEAQILAAELEDGSDSETETEPESEPVGMMMPPDDAVAEPDLESTQFDVAATATDELDSDLLPTFIEEGQDMLPELSGLLRSWRNDLENLHWSHAILRILHTLKGSARMAGAMRLGQHLHEMESGIEAVLQLSVPPVAVVDELLQRHDLGLQLFDQLQKPASDTPPASMGNTAVAFSSSHELTQPTEPQERHALVVPSSQQREDVALPSAIFQSPQVSSAMVRVRADILDRLVTQAGEVSISRSRLENGVDSLRQSLFELTENVGRLREQLREIEMQADSQISSRMQQTGEREFDPLEFDRYTRLQELTRMMAESVGDVSSVHTSLSRSLESASDDLGAQARLTRELQQDLMRARMVQFGSISERLFRVARVTSKEVDKRVNLDIRGSNVEIDRSVLEKMTGPFEHLLRNAIVHGIESRTQRVAGGKTETGELLIEVRQEGSEVVLAFSDDGQGLNTERIREKSVRLGLLSSDADASEDELQEMIFHPGFSTATEITELAGRGVGMDVVRSEVAALGGRVECESQAGRGTRFTIHLPLTLAVVQVVLVTTGGLTYAVPSVLVEQVLQLKAPALAASYNSGAVDWQGHKVTLHYLSGLLGDDGATPVAQQYSPIIIVKRGADRVALHVDEIVGNREVVVKNIGPQLSRMTGIAGATVLGTGDIVLILDPTPLAARMQAIASRNGRQQLLRAEKPYGAVIEMNQANNPDRAGQPVQGLRTQRIVMVVDDSLTVRRVTQRLLSREGYQVVLAKDGVDALEQLQVLTPDVMLLDIEMPRMDGFDLTRNIRGDARTQHIPIVMITSRTAEKHRRYAMELGVNEYLGKPYQEERLLKLIATYVQEKGVAQT